MAFDLTTDMDNVFLASGFEEDVEYSTDGVNYTTISAIVFRGSNAALSLNFRGAEPAAGNFDIQVAVSRTDVSDVHVNLHRIRLKDRPGDSTSHDHTITKIVHADAGMFRVKLL